jgi:hypothetical protein
MLGLTNVKKLSCDYLNQQMFHLSIQTDGAFNEKREALQNSLVSVLKVDSTKLKLLEDTDDARPDDRVHVAVSVRSDVSSERAKINLAISDPNFIARLGKETMKDSMVFDEEDSVVIEDGSWEELQADSNLLSDAMSNIVEALLCPLQYEASHDSPTIKKSNDEATSSRMVLTEKSNDEATSMVPTMLAVARFLSRQLQKEQNKNNGRNFDSLSALARRAWSLLEAPKVLEATAKEPLDHGNLLAAFVDLIDHVASETNCKTPLDPGCVKVLLFLHDNFQHESTAVLALARQTIYSALNRCLRSCVTSLQTADKVAVHSPTKVFRNDTLVESTCVTEALAVTMLLIDLSEHAQENIPPYIKNEIRQNIVSLIEDDGRVLQVILRRIIQSGTNDLENLKESFNALYILARQCGSCTNGLSSFTVRYIVDAFLVLCWAPERYQVDSEYGAKVQHYVGELHQRRLCLAKILFFDQEKRLFHKIVRCLTSERMHMDDKLYAVSQSIDLLTYIIVHDGNILPDKQDACYLEEEVQGRHFKAADVSLSKEYFRKQACVATMALVDIVSSPHSLDPLIVFGQLDEEPSKGDSFDRPALVDSDQGSLRGRLVPKKNDRASRTARALGDVFRSAQEVIGGEYQMG